MSFEIAELILLWTLCLLNLPDAFSLSRGVFESVGHWQKGCCGVIISTIKGISCCLLWCHPSSSIQEVHWVYEVNWGEGCF